MWGIIVDAPKGRVSFELVWEEEETHRFICPRPDGVMTALVLSIFCIVPDIMLILQRLM